MSPLGSPQVAQELARVLQARAGDLGHRGEQVSSRRADGWVGTAAERYRAWACQHGRTLGGASDALACVAARVRNEAARVQQEQNELRGIEGRLRDALRRAVPPGQQPPWAGTRWSPANLPPSGDPAWRAVARDLSGRI